MTMPLEGNAAMSAGASTDVRARYLNWRTKALAACFLGYMAFYIVRNNFALSTPYLKDSLGLSATQVGLLSSVLLVSYGLSKGYMGVFADKAHPKYFLACGLAACALANVGLGFSSEVWLFAVLIALNGTFQGMGSAPAYVVLANWYPKHERGRFGAIWNISHNVGGGLVAPIAALGLLWFGTAHWRIACYVLPAATAAVVAVLVLALGKNTPVREGLPALNAFYDTEVDPRTQYKANARPPHDMASWQILLHYVLTNRNAWFTSLVDTFVYVIRFGMVSWMPLYLLHAKGFSKAQMSVVFLVFEWAAIPSTLFAGWVSDKYFRGYRMPPAIIALALIFLCVFGYWKGSSLLVVTVSAGLIGCLIYVPQFLANVQCMEIVPPFAVGSAVGLRGFMSYIVGATIGTSLFGVMVDRVGWNGGIVVLFAGVAGCIVFCALSHLEIVRSERRVHDGAPGNLGP